MPKPLFEKGYEVEKKVPLPKMPEPKAVLFCAPTFDLKVDSSNRSQRQAAGKPAALFSGPTISVTEVTEQDSARFPEFKPEEILKLKRLMSTLAKISEQDIISFGSAINQKLSSQVDQLLRLSMTPLEDAVKRDLHSIVTLVSSFKLPNDRGFFSRFSNSGKAPEFSTEVNQVLDRLTLLTDTVIGKLASLQSSFNKYGELALEVDESRRALVISVKALECTISASANNEFLVRLENRLNDLNLSLFSTEQTVTQINVTKKSKLKLQENIRNLLEITIPAWKKQLLSTYTLSSNGTVNDSISKLDEEALNTLKDDISRKVSNLV